MEVLEKRKTINYWNIRVTSTYYSCCLTFGCIVNMICTEFFLFVNEYFKERKNKKVYIMQIL